MTIASRLASLVLAGLLGSLAFGSAPARAIEWNGLFVGLHVGKASSNLSGLHDQADAAGPFDFSSLDLDGGLFGVQGRVNVLVAPQFLVGVEADYSWASQDVNEAGPEPANRQNFYTVERDNLWSLRARAGFLPVPNVLIYGTAGWGGTTFRLQVDDNFGGGSSGSISLTETGAVLGGGVEVALNDFLTIKGEYLHYNVGVSTDLTDPPIPDSDPGDSISFDDIDVWRVAVNVRIGSLFGPAPAEPLK